MGPPLPKRQRQAAMVTVASPTVQEPEVITPKNKGGAPVSKEEIPAEMEPLRINVGHTRWVYHCHVEGCTEGSSNSQAAICSHGKWVNPSGSSDPVKVLFHYFTSFKPCKSYVWLEHISTIVSLCHERKVTSVKFPCRGLWSARQKSL